MAIETVDARARGLRPRQEAVTIGAPAAPPRLDPARRRSRATVAYGLVAIAAITRHDPGGSALHRQALYAGVGAVLFVVVLLIDPGPLPAAAGADLRRDARRDAARARRSARCRTARSGGSTSASSRSSRPSSGRWCSSSRWRASSPTARSTITSTRVPLTAIALGLLPILLVFVQPDIGTALVYARRAGRGAVLRRGALAAPDDPARAHRERRARACSGCCPRPASTC